MEDTVWPQLRFEAKQVCKEEACLAPLLTKYLLECDSLETALSLHLACKLSSQTLCHDTLQKQLFTAFTHSGTIGKHLRQDIQAIQARDPACGTYIAAFLYFKGFHALAAYRAAHYYWQKRRYHLALYLQSILSATLAVDIHPAAKIGGGILLDHGTSFVAGETAVIEDNVSLLHEVTLGGTGKEEGDRHPKIRQGVLIGSGAKILGNLEIGTGAKVGAGSVVLHDVPPHATVVGVPAKMIGKAKDDSPALCMDHRLIITTGEKSSIEYNI